MKRLTEAGLANKARHPSVWGDLIKNGYFERHVVCEGCLNAAAERLLREGNEEAAARVGDMAPHKDCMYDDFSEYDE
jgi:hypothetical protein